MPEIVNAVEMRGIVKRFPGVLANDHVDFDLRQGEVHALLGENGAGKSTLMNVLAGMYKPEEGAIFVDGKRVNFGSPRDAIAAGIGMIHQHFMLVPSQTVTENIILGLSDPRFFLPLDALDKRILALQEQYGLKVDPKAKIWQLSVGEQQRVEILKMLYRGAKVLIMDEPTAVLTPQEIDELFVTLRSMVATRPLHRLHQPQAGRGAGDCQPCHRAAPGQGHRGRTSARQGATKAQLAQLMVGREVVFTVKRSPAQTGRCGAFGRGCLRGERSRPARFARVRLQVRAGEIVGIAGVAGNGQSELAQVITGLRKCSCGRVLVNGEDIANQDPRAAIKRHVAHVPEDRTGVGSSPGLSLADNLIMKNYRESPVSRGWVLNRPVIRKQANAAQARVRHRGAQRRRAGAPPLRRQPAEGDPGARDDLGPKLIIAVQPTRGLDVGAIEAVQRVLLREREKGTAILLISEELEEIMSLSDRIVGIYEGGTWAS